MSDYVNEKILNECCKVPNTVLSEDDKNYSTIKKDEINSNRISGQNNIKKKKKTIKN